MKFMSEYAISSVSPKDSYTNKGVDELLLKEGIRRDKNLDYTAAMLDEDYNVIATGSCYGNTLRCMAVSSDHQGEALMNDIVSHLVEYQASRGNFHLFLYTKLNSAKFFGSLGFTEIARVESANIVFMENRRSGFREYLDQLHKDTEEQMPSVTENASGTGIAAIVMNANPFTLGHQYLVETAATASKLLHVFIVSEDASLVPFAIRKRLVMEGTAQWKNIIYHDSGSYMISSSTFPAYFQKDSDQVIEGQAGIDLSVFTKIAEALSINVRFVGDEPNSVVTGLYNKIMAQQLPEAGMECRIITRMTEGEADASARDQDKAISASTVRSAIQQGDFEKLKSLVPETTYRFFMSEEAQPIIKTIREAAEVIHY